MTSIGRTILIQAFRWTRNMATRFLRIIPSTDRRNGGVGVKKGRCPMSRLTGIAFVCCLASSVLLAQTSASYQLTESAFNAGGNPSPVLTSSSYQMTLDSVGDSISGGTLSSASYTSATGFPAAYPPPGEVATVLFTDQTTLVWTPEGSTGTYNLYRGLITDLPGSYGVCKLPANIVGETTTDAETPASGQCYFYLVTAKNRLAEEGTKGSDSEGTQHPNPSPCP
jgi:hypothetical protein